MLARLGRALLHDVTLSRILGRDTLLSLCAAHQCVELCPCVRYCLAASEPSDDVPSFFQLALISCLLMHSPEDVGYVSAHGSGVIAHDRIETAAIKQAFGAHASSLKISAVKPQLGEDLLYFTSVSSTEIQP